jgi:anti-sigma regulatory factor (Ser/Thr protein kinase)
MDVSLKFLVPSDPRFLAVVRAAVGELGEVYGFPPPERRGITLALDEAVANIIRHAYRGDPGGVIEVTCEAGNGRLEFTLLDHGEPPDPAQLRPHVLDDVALSGRGTHIIRSMMDEVSYERSPRGNQLRLMKRLPAARISVEGEKEKV